MRQRDVPPTFGERFTFARKRQAVFLVDEQDVAFAEAIGKSKAAVSGYYRQAEAPPKRTVDAMAARLGVSC